MPVNLRGAMRDQADTTVPAIAMPTSGTPPGATGAVVKPAVAVDLGSGYARLWASGWGPIADPGAVRCVTMPDGLVERGQIIDTPGCAAVINRLRRHQPALPPGRPLVVACRPVLASQADQDAIRRVITSTLGPARVLFADSLRAAAVGAGAASGHLLVVDIGAHLTEVALLADGGVVAARRIDLGTRDLGHNVPLTAAARVIAGHAEHLRRNVDARPETRPASPRRLLIVGGGATMPALRNRLVTALGMPVWYAPAPRFVAVRGAGIAALAARRHPGLAAT
jgi:rod shape-determining protein MreB